jgi:hypothetical protein
VDAVAVNPPAYTTSTIYTTPNLAYGDPGFLSSFTIYVGGTPWHPYLASFPMPGNLKLTWGFRVDNKVLHHASGPPYVWNVRGGHLEPFDLHIPYMA